MIAAPTSVVTAWGQWIEISLFLHHPCPAAEVGRPFSAPEAGPGIRALLSSD